MSEQEDDHDTEPQGADRRIPNGECPEEDDETDRRTPHQCSRLGSHRRIAADVASADAGLGIDVPPAPVRHRHHDDERDYLAEEKEGIHSLY